ncbi:metal-sulfur cluster assembly factor [Pedobacter nutrimenti]|uniref:Metal-sulfur cluster biosynthetic enzyme n=1 Tax=Pedobacter nutrimenti TaxID=1241337 RepID=A0A318U817_9SPHI|nr:metal-sulfur cluster assembly factor [Pedobacter nutrimenti]PYF70601.1 metal-sulfur cluster biosynthetic enzyme [Pedobacter nutrimenti]
MTISDIPSALKTVIDPELNLNIVDLGLVYALKLNETTRQFLIEMSLSSKFCPMGESILSATKNCMERTFPDYMTEVTLVWEPEWSYKFISEEGLKTLRGY